MKRTLTICALTMSISNCAHHRDVRAGTAGVHTFQMNFEDKEGGYDQAQSQAEHYCEEREKKTSFAVVSEDYKYTGTMKEEDYQRGKTLSKVAQGVGGAAVIFGGKNEQKAGSVAGVGGSIARGSMGKAYKYTMKFKCQ